MKDFGAKKDAMLRQGCPEEIVDELLTYREKENANIKYGKFLFDDSIRYLYPDVIRPFNASESELVEFNKQLAQPFINELERFKELYK